MIPRRLISRSNRLLPTIGKGRTIDGGQSVGLQAATYALVGTKIRTDSDSLAQNPYIHVEGLRCPSDILDKTCARWMFLMFKLSRPLNLYVYIFGYILIAEPILVFMISKLRRSTFNVELHMCDECTQSTK